ncbi:MAG: hypothetical protein HY822_13100 [Acidobacteria bacterium]|nr:hypothetical protein [Acidobacteriota bacterium]
MLAPKLLIPAGLLWVVFGCQRAARPLTVGGKSTVEQSFLAEVAAQHLENRLGVKVDRRPNLGDTQTAHAALTGSNIDLYPEHPCAALTTVLRFSVTPNAAAMWERVRAEYEVRFNLLWSPPLGFDNRFVVGIRKADADQFGVKTMADLARRVPGWRVAMTREFEIRRDGMPLVSQKYRIPFSSAPVVMDPLAIVQALDQFKAEVVAAAVADVVWERKDLVVLPDPAGALLPCEAAFVMRAEAEREHPGLQKALAELGGKVSLETVKQANSRLASGRVAVESAAHTFLREAGLSR